MTFNELYLSDDPKDWGSVIAKCEFANILNNPIKQRIPFKKAHSGRYIRFVALTSPNNKPWAGAAEFDVIEAR